QPYTRRRQATRSDNAGTVSESSSLDHRATQSLLGSSPLRSREGLGERASWSRHPACELRSLNTFVCERLGSGGNTDGLVKRLIHLHLGHGFKLRLAILVQPEHHLLGAERLVIRAFHRGHQMMFFEAIQGEPGDTALFRVL